VSDFIFSSPWHCPHTSLTAPRSRTIANGRTQYRRQCLACGRPVGEVVAKATALAETGGCPFPFDEAFHDERQRVAAKRAEAEAEARLREREAEEEAWWRWYNRYLQTDAWQKLRRKVLKRADGVCEGCAERPAQQVHHLTYKNAGNELLFQLVALCDGCHDIAHADKGGVR